MADHTPTPWQFHRTHALSQDRWYVLTDHDGRGPIMDVGGHDVTGQIAEAKHLITDEAVIEANAAFIVKAANNHDALVKVLSELLDACEADCGVPSEDDEDNEAVGASNVGPLALTFGMMRRARAALKEAGR